MTTAAILLSRQPLRPNGAAAWVRQVQAAVQWCKAHGHLILTSHGMQTWDLITAIAGMQQTPLRLYTLPSKNPQHEQELWLSQQFGLAHAQCEYCQLRGDDARQPELTRDKQIVIDADLIIPISIRPNGAMARLLDETRLTGKNVIEEFRCSYKARGERLAYKIASDELNPELEHVSGQYLFHWTRATNNPWPRERIVDYYCDIVTSESYPRTAFATMCRVLNDRLLIASPRHMPGNIPTVSFTGLAPAETVPLMRWRARYSEMSFEPYGIGIKKTAAERVGIRPVQYLQGSVSERDDRYWLTQSVGTKTDWRQEQEYRHRGDLTLTGFSSDELIVVCRTPDETRQIEERFRLTALSFCR